MLYGLQINGDLCMKTTAVILSAGKGKRMGTDTSKQYLELEGYPVIYYALRTFENSEVDNIILVSGKKDIEYCKKEIIEKYNFKKVRAVVEGGRERYNSVYEGIKAIENTDISTDILLIHDGARAFISEKTISDVIEATKKYKACVVGVRVKDTIKIADCNEYVDTTPDRKNVWQIQTPQAFDFEIIKNAYEYVIDNDIQGVTDDSMVLETYGGYNIKLIEGEYENIKITTPEDMYIGKAILNMRKQYAEKL